MAEVQRGVLRPKQFGRGNTDFGKVHTVRHQHQVADALGRCLLPRQIARRLLVLHAAAKRRDPASGLEVEARTGPPQVGGGGPVAQTEVLALFQHPKRWRRITHDVIVEALQLLVRQALVQHAPLAVVAGRLGDHQREPGEQHQYRENESPRSSAKLALVSGPVKFSFAPTPVTPKTSTTPTTALFTNKL
uniref:Uncharacterized protein n=1 Tax=Anopheles atroparvus TaxID=41427 RepID=A0A182J614_ANOAO